MLLNKTINQEWENIKKWSRSTKAVKWNSYKVNKEDYLFESQPFKSALKLKNNPFNFIIIE